MFAKLVHRRHRMAGRQRNDPVAAVVEERIGPERKSGDALARNGFEGGVDLRLVARRQDANRYGNGARCLSNFLQLAHGRCKAWVAEIADRCSGWHQHMQQSEPFCFQKIGQNVHPGYVAARPVVIHYKARLDRVAAHDEDDWDGGGRRLCSQRRRLATARDEHGHRPSDQLGRHRRQAIVLTVHKTIFHGDVLPFDIAGVAERLEERRHIGHEGFPRTGVEEPDHRHDRLLRACREWPRGGCAAEQRDELAPSHSITSSARTSSVGGISRPSALAVFRLITSSKAVGCFTGRSAGFSPLRIRAA